MIAALRGALDSVAGDHAVIDVGGVGYQCFCAPRVLSALGAPGDPVRLLIDTHVREDHIHLYGFPDEAERRWFRLLLTVQGVGARVALAILQVAPPERLSLAIGAQDRAVLTQADGVGPKLAGRILSELGDKIDSLAAEGGIGGAPAPTAAAPAGGTVTADAISALVNLGYGRSDAHAAIARAAAEQGEDATLDSLIKAGLKALSQ